MSLLDCGCGPGPGTITLGLAERLTDGEVVGTDLDESALESARTRARERGITNIRFETGSVYELPFPDNSFDAVFSHAVLEHLRDPVAALREMHRVLKPGGMAGVRTPDFDGILWTPADPLLDEWVEIALRRHAEAGGDICRGKHLRRFLREAGYVRSSVSASYEVYATPDTTRMQADRHTGKKSISSRWLDKGIIDKEQKAQLDKAWRRWAEHPDAFLAVAWGEAIGRKAK